MSPARYENRGSESACVNPCSQSLPTEYGKGLYKYEITDSGGNSYNPAKLSGALDIPFTQSACSSTPFSVPVPVHGFKDYTSCYIFTVAGGTDVSALRIWLNTFNLRQNMASVFVNSQAEKILKTTPIVGFASNGSACTGITREPHGLSTGNLVQLNGFTNQAGGLVGVAVMNNNFTVASAPTATTFAVACSLASGEWYSGSSGVAGLDHGATVSKTVFYGDDKRHHGGMYLPHETFQSLVPLGPTEITAGATNTLSLRFKDVSDVSLYGLQHGWYTDWAIVQPDVEISQIVVSGGSLNAVATTTTNHGWSDGDTVIIRDAPGPKWRFNGKCVVTSHTTNTFTFAWGCGIPAGSGTAGVYPYLTPNGTYTINPSRQPTIMVPGKMYAARSLIPASSYSAYDPTAPDYGGDASAGATAYAATLKDPNNWLPNNASLAKCGDCHAKDGRDLKYFGFNQYVTVVAAMRRGLTETQAKNIAAFMAANTVGTPANGRPWNSPYQPMPGIDSGPIGAWAAGGGEHWTLVRDEDMYEYACPSSNCVTLFVPTAKMNTHELPTYVPMPSWLDYLPQMHPLDFWNKALGLDFTTNPLYTHVQAFHTDYPICQLASGITNATTAITLNNCTNVNKYSTNDYLQVGDEYVKLTAGAGTTSQTWTRGQCPVGSGCPAATSHGAGAFVSDFTAFVNGTTPYVDQTADTRTPCTNCAITASSAYQWPARYGKDLFDVFPLTMSHTWEVRNRFRLENFNDRTDVNLFGTPNARCTATYQRGWSPSLMLFRWGPHVSVGGGGEPYFLNNGSSIAITNWNRFTTRAYHLQAILYAGNCHGEGNAPIDTPYQFAFYNTVSQLRPAAWTSWVAAAFMTQAAFGWANLTAEGTSYPSWGIPSISRLSLSFTGSSVFQDLFATDAKQAEYVNAAAQMLKGVVDSSVYSVADWQTHFTAYNCPLTQVAVPSAVGAPNYNSNCTQDNMAFAMTMFSHFGVDATTKNMLGTWMSSVWPASAPVFAAAKTATCSYTAGDQNVQPVLTCTNF